MRTDAFRGQVAIVTGASAGIGKALALQLARQGARVSIAARRAERLEQVAADGRALGTEVLVVPTDVADEAQCQALVEKTVAAFSRLDMLINNAGTGAEGLLEELPDLTLFKRVMDVNFYGTVYCTYYAVKHLKQTQGRIVNISSLSGRTPLPSHASYIASKHAVQGFSDSLRMELAKAGVSVTVICPYYVATGLLQRMAEKSKPRGPAGRGIDPDKVMTADHCAQIVLKSAARRKREVLMGPSWLIVWLRLIAPGLSDKVIIEMFLKPATRREKKVRS